MTLRARYAWLLAGGTLAAVAGASACLLSLQRAALERQALERPAVLMESVEKVALEALLADDPMVLLSHLGFLLRSRPELRAARVRQDGRWLAVPGSRDEPGRRVAVSRVVRAGAPGSPELAVEMAFSAERLLLEARAATEEGMRAAWLVAVLVGLCVLPASLWISRRLSRPLEELEAAMEELASGRSPPRLADGSDDEVGRLARGFNGMARRLGELERAKKDFFSKATHELRTPLGAIESLARALEANPSLDVPGRAHLQRIQASAQRLARFVTELLEAARVERGTLDLSFSAADLAAVARDVAAFLTPRAREAGLRLSLELPSGPLEAQADPERLEQVLVNLVGNAIKFTPRGGRVTLYGHARRREGVEGFELGVIDTGPGIPAEDLPRLFQPFERAGNAARTPGAGLGLSIAKAIIEMHGGRIDVESTPGAGSRFYFFIPRRQAKTARGGKDGVLAEDRG